MRRLELYESIRTTEDAIGWSRDRGLLLSSVTCQICGDSMNEVRHNCLDGVIWKCSRTLDGSRHFRSVSIRAGSIFSGSNISIKIIIFALYEWSVKTPLEQTAFQLEIEENTVKRLFQLFRSIAGRRIGAIEGQPIGGAGDIVEIDECQLGRRKNHRGRVPREIWVFGGIVRGSFPTKLFIEIVANRKKTTLTEVIQRKIAGEAHIISDGWKGYEDLHLLGYQHSVINHTLHFVDPGDCTIHTQSIENLWCCVRRFLRSKGTSYRTHLAEYIHEFIFRKTFIDPFEQMLSSIEQETN